MRGSFVPSTVTFEVEWSGPTAQTQIGGADKNFMGQISMNSAKMAVTAKEAGFTFVSDPASTSKSTMAEIGILHVGASPVPLSATPFYGADGDTERAKYRQGRLLAE